MVHCAASGSNNKKVTQKAQEQFSFVILVGLFWLAFLRISLCKVTNYCPPSSLAKTIGIASPFIPVGKSARRYYQKPEDQIPCSPSVRKADQYLMHSIRLKSGLVTEVTLTSTLSPGSKNLSGMISRLIDFSPCNNPV